MQPNRQPTSQRGFGSLAVGFVCGFALVVALATEARADRVNARQHHQRNRLERGWKSGELKRGEARAIRARQAQVARLERRIRANGVVTPEERARLEKKQDQASRQIYRLKHNGNDREEASE